MKSANELWEDMGSLSEDDVPHVLTKLFLIYDKKLEHDPKAQEALDFFKHLDNAISQTSECNLNRR